MPSKKQRIITYLTPEEYTQISESAARAGISRSTFTKRICTGMPVHSIEHKEVVREMLKIRADLGRLGGLLKLAWGKVKARSMSCAVYCGSLRPAKTNSKPPPYECNDQ